jgi:renalase
LADDKNTQPVLGTVAVIGAGMAGLSCARRLADDGAAVTVFEKSRGVGGRMATRRADDGLRFDHGAQYFTVRDPRFEQQVARWIECGAVSPWDGRIRVLEQQTPTPTRQETARFVGLPGMNGLCRQLASGLPIQYQTRVTAPRLADGLWHLNDEQGASLGEFEGLVVATPAPQAADLLSAVPRLAAVARDTAVSACWAVMAAFPQALELGFDGAFVHDSELSWIARDSSKPGRDPRQETWVLHATADWTARHLEDDAEDACRLLLEAFWQATGAMRRQPDFAVAHRWRYALVPEPIDARFLLDGDLRIGVCGDWCGGPRVEGAYLSGLELADRLRYNPANVRPLS